MQHPQDYLDDLRRPYNSFKRICITEDVIVGVDFTSCTISQLTSWVNPMFDKNTNPTHAYGSYETSCRQDEANNLNKIAEERGGFLKLYGGKISSEWLIPRWQIL